MEDSAFLRKTKNDTQHLTQAAHQCDVRVLWRGADKRSLSGGRTASVVRMGPWRGVAVKAPHLGGFPLNIGVVIDTVWV